MANPGDCHFDERVDIAVLDSAGFDTLSWSFLVVIHKENLSFRLEDRAYHAIDSWPYILLRPLSGQIPIEKRKEALDMTLVLVQDSQPLMSAERSVLPLI